MTKSNVASKVALLLRRRVGSLREDRDFDTIVRHKHIHILAFSMIGLIVMMAAQVVTWSSSSVENNLKDAYQDDDDVSATLINLLFLSQAVVSSSTIVTIVLITQKYRLILMTKRAEWSGSNLFEVEALRGDTVLNTHDRDSFVASYSFWSSFLKYQYLTEVLIHLPHPVVWMASIDSTSDPKNILYKLLQIVMFLRIYVVPNILHLFSKAYISRFEVVNSDRDLISVGFQIQQDLTLKMLFYRYTVISLVAMIIASIVIFGFCIFTLERKEGRVNTAVLDSEFGSLWNSLWFSYITFATVGYGEYAPTGVLGRICAALNAVVGISTFTVFSAVLVSRVSLTKEQKHGVEYLATRAGDERYRDAAATLIQVSMKTFIRPRIRNTQAEDQAQLYKHKGNRLHSAIKGFRDARRELESAFMQAEDTIVNQKVEAIEKLMQAVRRDVEQHQEELANFEEEVQLRLRGILNRVAAYGRLGHTAV